MYSLSNLKRRSGRTTLTIAGITLAIALMVVMFSLGNGIRDSSKALLAETGVDIFCQANGTSANRLLGEIDDGRNISYSMIEGHDNIRTAYPIFVHTMYSINETTRQALLLADPTDIENITLILKKMKIEGVTLNGIIPELEGKFGGMEYLEGDGFTRNDDPFYADGTYDGGVTSPNFTHEISVNKVLADKLKLKAGDMVFVNNNLPANITELPSWLINVTHFKVVMVVQASWEALGLTAGYVHLSELQYLAGKKNDTVHQILVDLKDPTKDKKVKRWIEDSYPELDAHTVEDFLGEIEEMTAVFRGFGEMILLVTGTISVMFTSTVMIIAIRERTTEIAALRAIGFSKRTIFGTIVMETFFIILIGFAIGFAMGLPMAYAIDGYLIDMSGGGGGHGATADGGGLPAGFHFISITPLLIVQMTAVALVFGIFSGLIPAIWATRLNIAETLKKE